MKSVIIRDINGKILFRIKDTKNGVDAKVAADISPLVSILVINDDGRRTQLTECKRQTSTVKGIGILKNGEKTSNNAS